jgi:hypothetical protein
MDMLIASYQAFLADREVAERAALGPLYDEPF